MPNKPRVKNLIARKLEDSEYRRRHEARYSAFKLEAQILYALERKGWSYEQLAEATDTYKSNVSRDLRAGGILKASFSRVSKIAGALGMTLITLLIPKEQEATVVPRIDAIVRTSFDNHGIPVIQPQIINTEVVKKPVINAGAGSNYTIAQDQTIVICDESAGYMAAPHISR
jgi:transcriptional regulator with XRE-family HTH domain